MRRLNVSLVCLLLVLSACQRQNPTLPERRESPTPAMSLSITSPAEGDVIQGNTVELGIDHRGVEIVKADGDTSGKTAHFHVFIDRAPVAAGETIPAEPDIVHSTDNPVVIPGLSPGSHHFVVVLGDGNHTRIGELQAELTVELAGPSIDATAPPSITQGENLVVDIAATGLRVVAAPEGRQEERTGHFHLLIDRPLPEYGKAIPADANIVHTTSTRVEVPNLTVGDHTIWIVVGDGGHVPYRPLVADRVTVKVT